MASAVPLPQLNPVSPENLLDPVPLYRELRSHDPVHWSETVNSWFITRHDDVTACFRDKRLSSNRMQFFESQFSGPLGETVRDLLNISSRQMAMRDGAEHLRLRRNANPGFTPLALDAWRPAIRRTMNMLVDQVVQQGQMDLVSAVSYQLPPLVISELFAIPAEDREHFQSWAMPIARFFSPTVDVDPMELAREANAGALKLSEYVKGAIESRRGAAQDDMLSRMMHSQEAGGMSMEELVANAMLLISAGHLTTTDQLSNGVHDLLTHPEELRKLREDPGLLKSAVEEILRFRPALPFINRIAVEDFQLRGRTIRKGDIVFLGMAAANRDPEVFPEPDRFDITRDHIHQKHHSFGFGQHHCLGAGLARRELELALELLLTRLPGLRLDEERPAQVKCSSLLFRGFDSLPVRW